MTLHVCPRQPVVTTFGSAQALLQPPQLAGSWLISTSQPSPGSWLQSAQTWPGSAWQAEMAHSPERLQIEVAFGRVQGAHEFDAQW
jgi:hypothetical protein